MEWKWTALVITHTTAQVSHMRRRDAIALPLLCGAAVSSIPSSIPLSRVLRFRGGQLDAWRPVQGLPALRWLGEKEGTAAHNDGVLTMTTGEKTDWFNPPPGEGMPSGLANAPALVLNPPAGDWQLSAQVQVGHQFLFDAGTLFVHQGPDDWCKLCFEMSPEGKPTVVSVVTRGVSDDANGVAVDSTHVHLRVSKCGSAIAFHYSLDGGAYWTLHRIFSLREPSAPMSVGFLAQCPTGQACTAAFSDIALHDTTLRDPRDGS